MLAQNKAIVTRRVVQAPAMNSEEKTESISKLLSRARDIFADYGAPTGGFLARARASYGVLPTSDIVDTICPRGAILRAAHQLGLNAQKKLLYEVNQMLDLYSRQLFPKYKGIVFLSEGGRNKAHVLDVFDLAITIHEH